MVTPNQGTERFSDRQERILARLKHGASYTSTLAHDLGLTIEQTRSSLRQLATRACVNKIVESHRANAKVLWVLASVDSDAISAATTDSDDPDAAAATADAEQCAWLAHVLARIKWRQRMQQLERRHGSG